MALPASMLHRSGRSLCDAGVRKPDRSASVPMLAAVGVSMALGILLSRLVPDPLDTPLHEAIALALVIPEHLLIFGVFGACLSSAQRLTGSLGARVSVYEDLFVVAATGSIFGLIHVGVESPLVLLTSFPLGWVYAFVTMRTGSIWPAILAHWAMNIVPMTWDALAGRWTPASAPLPGFAG